MKKELGVYGFYYLPIVLAVVAAGSFCVGQNWFAMVWALLAGGYAAMSLRTLRDKDKLERDLRASIARLEKVAGSEAE